MSVKIQVRRGLDSQRQLVVLADGEPAFTIDTKKFYIGDGLTAGGIEITGSGSGGTVLQTASDTVEGIVLLTQAPAVAGIAVAVGDNDPRMTDARTPKAHVHAGVYEAANSNIQNHISNTTTNPHNVTASQIGAQPSLGFTPEDASKKNAVNGYAGLGSDGKILTSQLPLIAINDTFVVASQAAQTALTAEVGDVAVRTDLTKTFILKTSPATVFANWQELLTPAGSGSGSTTLAGLIDVSVGAPADQNLLIWSTGSSKWIAGTPASLPSVSEKSALAGTTGTPGAANKFVTDTDLRLTNARTPSVHSHVIGDISSFVLTTPLNGQALTYNSATGKWVNTAVAGGAASIATLTDALISSPSNGQVLTYNGTKWVNSAATGGSGSAITRYQAGLASNYVVADKTGVTVSIAAGTATFANPNGANVFSASVYFSVADIGSVTTIDINFQALLNGLNTSYTNVFIPQYQVFVDDLSTAGTTAYKSAVTANIKKGAGILTLIGVAAGNGYWINISL